MLDVTDQLRRYHDRAVDEVDAVSAADVVAPDAHTPCPNLHAEPRPARLSVQILGRESDRGNDGRSRGRLAWLAAAAAVVALLAAGVFAIARGGDDAGLGSGSDGPEPVATYDGSAAPTLVITAGDERLELRPNAASSWNVDPGDGMVEHVISDFAAPEPAKLETFTVPAGTPLAVTLPGPRWRVRVEFTQNGTSECPIRYKEDLPRSDSGDFTVPTPVPVGEYMAVVSASLPEGGRVWVDAGYAFNVQTAETSALPPRTAEVNWHGSHEDGLPDEITIWHPDALDDHAGGDGTNISIGTSDYDTTVGLEPYATAECGRGVTYLMIPEADRTSIAGRLGVSPTEFGVDVRFPDGLYASERVEITGDHMVVPLDNVANNPSPDEPTTAPDVPLTFEPIALPTYDTQGGGHDALFQGVLVLDGPCLYAGGGEDRNLILWPDGSALVNLDGEVAVRLPSGSVVGPVGQEMESGGGGVFPASAIEAFAPSDLRPECVTEELWVLSDDA